MGALKKLKKKLSASSKKFMNDKNSKNPKTVLGDVTNASQLGTNKRGKTLKRATKSAFRTADVSRSSNNSNITAVKGGGASLKAVEIFEDDEAFEQQREGGSKAPPPSSASDSVSPASSKSSKSALDQWADHLILPVLLPVGGFNENKEEEKEQPETPTKTTDDDEEVMNVVFSSDTVVDSGFAASPIVVSYELSESECGTPGEVEERVLGNVESVVLANDNEAVDVAEEEGEDALESYLFTPPPVNLAKKDTLKEDAVEEEKKNTNTQSARLSSSMWDVKMMHNVSFMKNVSAMDVAMGAGVAAVVFNFFMPSFLKASF